MSWLRAVANAVCCSDCCRRPDDTSPRKQELKSDPLTGDVALRALNAGRPEENTALRHREVRREDAGTPPPPPRAADAPDTADAPVKAD